MVFYHSNRKAPNTVPSISFIYPSLLLKSAISPVSWVFFLKYMVYLTLEVCIAIGSVFLIFFLNKSMYSPPVPCVHFAGVRSFLLCGYQEWNLAGQLYPLNHLISSVFSFSNFKPAVGWETGSKACLMHIRIVLNLKIDGV